jgi:hypothetical protein
MDHNPAQHIQMNAASTVILKGTAHACSILRPLPRRAIMHAHPSKIPAQNSMKRKLSITTAQFFSSSDISSQRHQPGK